MKGLDWFKVVSNIAFDDDLEHRSDAAFRTFLELVGISAFDLTDGKVAIERARKLCNSPLFDDAIVELSDAKNLRVSDTFLAVPNYKKYQQTRREVASKRAKTRKAVNDYRAITKDLPNDVKCPKSKSQSKSKNSTTVSSTSTVSSVGPPRQDAGALTAYFLDESKKRGLVVTDSDKGQLARYAKQALDQGASFENVKAAINKMLDKGLSPRLLGQLVNETKPEVKVSEEDHWANIQRIRERLASERA